MKDIVKPLAPNYDAPKYMEAGGPTLSAPLAVAQRHPEVVFKGDPDFMLPSKRPVVAQEPPVEAPVDHPQATAGPFPGVVEDQPRKRGRPLGVRNGCGSRTPGKPRDSFANKTLLAMVESGFIRTSDMAKMANTVRSFYSRISEMRQAGLIEDAVMLTEEGRAQAQELLERQQAYQEFLQKPRRQYTSR